MVYTVRHNGKTYFVKGSGGFYYLTKDSNGALENLPEGYQIKELKNGRLTVSKK
jgi:hypothetical protein